jgi:hypothetical protein
MNNELIVLLIVCLMVFWRLILPKFLCKITGHKLNDGVLWKQCFCCHKIFYLNMRSGKYVE